MTAGHSMTPVALVAQPLRANTRPDDPTAGRGLHRPERVDHLPRAAVRRAVRRQDRRRTDQVALALSPGRRRQVRPSRSGEVDHDGNRRHSADTCRRSRAGRGLGAPIRRPDPASRCPERRGLRPSSGWRDQPHRDRRLRRPASSSNHPAAERPSPFPTIGSCTEPAGHVEKYRTWHAHLNREKAMETRWAYDETELAVESEHKARSIATVPRRDEHCGRGDDSGKHCPGAPHGDIHWMIPVGKFRLRGIASALAGALSRSLAGSGATSASQGTITGLGHDRRLP